MNSPRRPKTLFVRFFRRGARRDIERRSNGDAQGKSDADAIEGRPEGDTQRAPDSYPMAVGLSGILILFHGMSILRDNACGNHDKQAPL